MAKLGEVCNFYAGTGFPNEYQGRVTGKYPFYKVGDISKNVLEGNRELKTCANYVEEDVVQKLKGSILPPKTIVFAKIGEALKLNRRAITSCECLVDNNVMGVKAQNGRLNDEYLFYWLQNLNLSDYSESTTVPSVKKSRLQNIEINVSPLEEQEKVVSTLNKLSSLILARKKQLSKLDELVKARFVEMFGDPVVNSKRWPVETIENHIDLLTGFPFDSSGYVSKGVNICGGLIIMPQKIDWSACKHWPQITGYEDYILRPNDIVIALDRPWISNGFKIAMVDREHLPALLIQRTARIRAVDINQHYLMQSLLLGRFDKHCNITGSLVPHISPKDIKSYSVMIPPIELQNQFAAFVERVDQQKQTVQQSLEKLELMKKALMQEYFG